MAHLDWRKFQGGVAWIRGEIHLLGYRQWNRISPGYQSKCYSIRSTPPVNHTNHRNTVGQVRSKIKVWISRHQVHKWGNQQQNQCLKCVWVRKRICTCTTRWRQLLQSFRGTSSSIIFRALPRTLYQFTPSSLQISRQKSLRHPQNCAFWKHFKAAVQWRQSKV